MLRRLKRFLGSLSAVMIGLASAASAESIERARQLFEGGRYAEARSELLQLRKNAAAAYYLGRIALVDNDGEEAVRQLEHAIGIEDGNALYHLWLGNALGDQAQHAGAFKMMFIARRMKQEWERAVQLDPAQIDARLGLVHFHTVAPGIAGGSMEAARLHAAEIEKLDPARGAMARGLIAAAEKNEAAEILAYQQAIAAAPDGADGYFALGHLYARGGKGTLAFATLDRYAQRRPGDAWVAYQTGRFAGIAGLELDRGERALEQFIAAPAPDAHAAGLARAHYWLGQIAEKRGGKEAARGQYLEALAIDPKNQTARKALEKLE